MVHDQEVGPFKIPVEIIRRCRVGWALDFVDGFVPEWKDMPLYTLDVFIISGPMTTRFARKNRVLCRVIQISASQTLKDLHHAIFHAFDREEEHWYEFQVGGKGPMDPKARRYVLRSAMEIPIRGSPKPAGDVARTTIDSLGLNVGEAFGYWFDFGDDWWHQINVAAIGKERRRGKLPRVVKRIGASPPQYVDPDDAP